MNTPNPNHEIATLAGGCFWGMEDLVRKIPGVIDTEVGYAGGHTKNPAYISVKHGDTGHAESLQITFDPSKVTYETLLTHFFRMHDPTTLNQQGNDRGTQYRSVIFFHSPEQQKIAEQMKITASEKYKKPAVTQIVPYTEFTKAEDYHQDYLEKNPDGYTCHYMREW